jgi:hypothetical protein
MNPKGQAITLGQRSAFIDASNSSRFGPRRWAISDQSPAFRLRMELCPGGRLSCLNVENIVAASCVVMTTAILAAPETLGARKREALALVAPKPIVLLSPANTSNVCG